MVYRGHSRLGHTSRTAHSLSWAEKNATEPVELGHRGQRRHSMSFGESRLHSLSSWTLYFLALDHVSGKQQVSTESSRFLANPLVRK